MVGWVGEENHCGLVGRGKEGKREAGGCLWEREGFWDELEWCGIRRDVGCTIGEEMADGRMEVMKQN